MTSRRKFIGLSLGVVAGVAAGFDGEGPDTRTTRSFNSSGSRYGRLTDVNATDISGAIRMGCRTMQSIFNADDNNLPFMLARVRPDALLGFSPTVSDAHVPGRHLNALLNAEDAVGVALDETAIEKHRRAAFLSFDGPLPLPMNRTSRGGPRINFAAHNLREGLHALYALVKYRHDQQAQQIAEACIAAIFRLWTPKRGWDEAQLAKYGINHVDRNENFVRTLPRMLGPLVKYYRATGYDPALELAVILKDKLLAEHFPEDGAYDIAVQGTHGHSIACVLSSLAQLAELTQDSVVLSRVKSFYDNGMWKLRDQMGWVVEKTGDSAAKRPDVGEVNSSGDLVESALILGRFGYPYFEDAERIIRCHILPSQLRDIGFIKDSPNPTGEDGKRDVARRLKGAWGHPAPYGHEPLELEGFAGVLFTLDIVGGVVGSLCEAYRNIVTSEPTGHHVNLLFDHETDGIKVESMYTHASLRITLKKPGALWIRMPSWVEPQRVIIDGAAAVPRMTSSYLLLGQQPTGRPVTIHYDLPLRTIVLQHRTRNIHARLQGDQVAAMDNFGADLTFFDGLDG
jgi:hypothetical protein